MSPPGSDPRRPGAGGGRARAGDRPARPAGTARRAPGRPGAAGPVAGAPRRPPRRPPRAVIRRRRAVAGLAVALVAAGVALSVALQGGGPAPAPAASPGGIRRGLGVGTARCTFIEHTAAPTYDYLTRTESTTRTLVVDLAYPSRAAAAGPPARGAAPDRAGGPFPLVLFASGYKLDPSAYAPLLDAWVRSGIVVAAPVFPYTNPRAVARARALVHGANPEDDLANEPGDVAFVARQVIADSTGAGRACPVLEGLVDPGELGLAGQSDGGQVAGMLGYDERATAPGLRVQADEVLSGVANGTDPYAGGVGHPALLVVQSTDDTCNTPEQAADLYDEIDQGDKWFLEDHARTHLGPYVGASRAFGVVAAVTTRFFGLELHGRRPGARFLELGNGRPSLAVLRRGGVAPVTGGKGDGGVGCYER